MNKRIFSLAYIALYVLLDASIHCSEQKRDRSKTSGLRSRIIRTIKKIKRNNSKNDIEFERETQLNNNNNKNDTNYNRIPIEDGCCYYFCPCYMMGVLIANSIRRPISIFKF
ncbi:fam-c protein [Plasmodium vinckei brucechwatti]|uniref:Fam-c protein n=1 Tax=Plasmodium vinckei brucechwatti TaxID=119398 RepID=A0A6V7SCN2_PLAVN|nr:fam-c protein [Plasmodium vinckei brucechwatti]